PIAAKDAEREAYSAGLSRATLLRARKVAGVTAERVGGLGKAGAWQWRLGSKALTEPLRHPSPEGESLSQNLSALGELHHQCARHKATPLAMCTGLGLLWPAEPRLFNLSAGEATDVAGRGPMPNPQAARRRRGSPQRGEWQSSPGVGWQQGPLPDPPDGLMAASEEAWRT